MSEKKNFPAALRILIVSSLVGVLVSAGCLSGMAALMVSRGLSGSIAAPLATAAAGMGSFCGGWVLAFCQRERGLLCGTVQGILLAVLLTVLALPAETLIENTVLLRLGIVVLCGSLGGFLGVRSPRKKHLD